MNQSERNSITQALLANCGRIKKDAMDYPDAPGYKVFDPSVYSGIVNASRDFAKVLVDARCVFMDNGQFEHVLAYAKETDSEDELYSTLAYLTTWGSAHKVHVAARAPDNDYFDFCILGPDPDAHGPNRILNGGVKFWAQSKKWEVHT
jgi:hypothetical protein